MYLYAGEEPTHTNKPHLPFHQNNVSHIGCVNMVQLQNLQPVFAVNKILMVVY